MPITAREKGGVLILGSETWGPHSVRQLRHGVAWDPVGSFICDHPGHLRSTKGEHPQITQMHADREKWHASMTAVQWTLHCH